MAIEWKPGESGQSRDAAPKVSAGIRTADGRTVGFLAKGVVGLKAPVEHNVETLEAINAGAGKVKKINYVPYNPFGVTDSKMDHKALVAVFTEGGRLFFSVPQGTGERTRTVYLVEGGLSDTHGDITLKSSAGPQALSFSSKGPLQHYMSTITPNELAAARALLEAPVHYDLTTEEGEGEAAPAEAVVLAAAADTRQALSRSMGFILEADLEPADEEPVEHIVSLAQLRIARPAAVAGTLQVKTVPDTMAENMIADRVVVDPNCEVPLPLRPEEPEEFALFETPREGVAPRDFLRVVIFGGVVATSVYDGEKWEDYKELGKGGLFKAPGRGAGYTLSLHVTGAADDNVSVSAIRDPIVLSRLKSGSTGLDSERLKSSRTAADRTAALKAHLEKIRADRLRPRSGSDDLLATALPAEFTGRNTILPRLGDASSVEDFAPTSARRRVALAVGAAIGFAAVVGAAGIALSKCTDNAPQGEVSGVAVPDED